MINLVEMERRMQAMIEEASGLQLVAAGLPEAIPDKSEFIVQTLDHIEVSCSGDSVFIDDLGSRDKRTADDLTTEWIRWSDEWRFEITAPIREQMEAWWLRAHTVSGAIFALMAEGDTFAPFKSGRAKDLDREVWRPGMHDAEARWELARQIGADVDRWLENFLEQWLEIPVINFFVLTGIELEEIDDPCPGAEGTRFTGFHREGPWFEMEKSRLNLALSNFHVETASLTQKILELPQRWKSTFKLFRRGSQTGKRGL
jgi:hypothetical protein